MIFHKSSRDRREREGESGGEKENNSYSEIATQVDNISSLSDTLGWYFRLHWVEKAMGREKKSNQYSKNMVIDNSSSLSVSLGLYFRLPFNYYIYYSYMQLLTLVRPSISQLTYLSNFVSLPLYIIALSLSLTNWVKPLIILLFLTLN